MPSLIDRYWTQFLHSLPIEVQRPLVYYEAFYFGTTKEEAQAIAPLVLTGTKTATGSLLWTFEAEGKQPPQVGDFSIVTDGEDKPLCVTQTTEMRVLAFDTVDERFAFDSGEWDRTLEAWRKAYWSYIVYECARLGREPTAQTPLVCERFKVVYQEPLHGAAHCERHT